MAHTPVSRTPDDSPARTAHGVPGGGTKNGGAKLALAAACLLAAGGLIAWYLLGSSPETVDEGAVQAVVEQAGGDAGQASAAPAPASPDPVKAAEPAPTFDRRGVPFTPRR